MICNRRWQAPRREAPASMPVTHVCAEPLDHDPPCRCSCRAEDATMLMRSLEGATMSNCECCGKEPSVGVASVPGVAMSIAWGRACLDAHVVPQVVACFWRDSAEGQIEHLEPWVLDMIENTLDYFDVDDAEAWWAQWQPLDGMGYV